MPQHNRAKEHEAIALAIKSAKRKLFEQSRNGRDLSEALDGFFEEVRTRCARILEIGGAAAMVEKDTERFDELEAAIRAQSEIDQKGGEA